MILCREISIHDFLTEQKKDGTKAYLYQFSMMEWIQVYPRHEIPTTLCFLLTKYDFFLLHWSLWLERDNEPFVFFTASDRQSKVTKVGRGSPKGTYTGKGQLNQSSLQDNIQGLTPISSTNVKLARNTPLTQKFPNPENNRPSTPVTVIGYPSGFPKGLHIVGNKSPQPVKVTANFLNHELNDIRQDLGGAEKGKLGHKSMRFNMKIHEGLPESSAFAKESQKARGKKHGSGWSKRSHGHAELDKMRDDTRRLKAPALPVAPWKEISSFQSPGEHRRQTFNSFKMMSPDPPKTPVEGSPRHAVKGTSRTSRDSKMDQTHMNFMSSNIWSSREDSYYNSALIASSLTNTSKRGERFANGRSITGLSLSGRPASDQDPLKTVSSYTGNAGRNKKFTVISPAPVVLPSNQSLILVSGNVTAAEVLAPPKGSAATLGANNSQGQWNSILQTNSIPVPPSKRLEQARHMNHILYGGYNGHDAASARVEAREKYSYPYYQRYSGASSRQGQYQMNALGQTAPAKQKPQKPILQPPVHVPGPKRENIYIGQYDGSDSDSDDDTSDIASKPTS
ncbi:unnamed protein product [Allacma fusca]|uniref:Uncharacterized protein n=1 Tax=Allacma fusca TaxID=39272 RepID=A0A8J2KV84_9HEXA|nr:unnamed protein product [Allacma fusca]